MEETVNTRAIILNSSPYRESDTLITVFSLDFGRLSLVVRGAKKISSKMAGHLEPMTIAKIMIIKGRGFSYVGGALGEKSFLAIREDLNKLFYAGKIMALFSSLVKENEKDERLFSLLSRYLELIDEEKEFNKDLGELFFLRFSLSFLKEAGYQPELNNCLICQKKLMKGNNYFNLKDGGIICPSCFEENMKNNEKKFSTADILTISNNCVIILRFLLDIEQKIKLKASKKIIKEASNLTKKFILYLK